jgi:NAD(P)-dependent dehydrogenase (short-subunit alcohol dehydrogenase family)
MASRAALITGGSSGIGLAIARALGQDDYAVTISARRPDKLEAAARKLQEEGIDAEAVPANMAEEEEIKQLVAAHRARCGRLDVLINNAGIGIGSAVADMPTKKLDLQLDVNLRGVYLIARESIAGKHGQGWLSAYSATKFGVVGLSQGLHKELSGDGIQVTALCPGFVATDMTDWVEGQVPKEEMIQPEDIAEAVRYLLRTSRNCIVPELQFIRPGDSEI